MAKIMTKNAARVPIIVGAAMMAVLVVPVIAADRPSDKDVKQLLERVNNDRDRFEDQLDGKLKDSIVRSPSGEVNVARYLDDLQDNVGKMKDRFSSDYAASTEVTTVLRQGSDIQRFMSTQPPGFNGASEWNRLAGSLGELAAAYGTTFPLPDGAQARRMNDNEVRRAADDVATNADRFKKELDSSLKQDKAIDKTTRETAVKDADSLKKDAERLASTVGDGKPASGEAQALLQHAATIRGAGRTLSPATQTAWGSVESSLAKVAQAFGLPARRP